MNDEIRDATDLNIDQLLELMELDEKEDAPLITPVDYAKLRTNISPQIVYYHLRQGHIIERRCPCGRKTMILAEADEYFESIGRLPKRGGSLAGAVDQGSEDPS
jgi:hypothetical protein